MKTPFEAWYERSGKHIDPQLTREEFATAAFEDGFQIGMAQSRNYIADEETMPETVTFANGRIVRIADNKTPGVHHGVFLEVE